MPHLDFRVRELKEKDLPFVLNGFSDIYGHALCESSADEKKEFFKIKEKITRAIIKKNLGVACSLGNNNPVGCGLLYPQNDKLAELILVYMAEGNRGQNGGTAIVKRIGEIAKERGIIEIGVTLPTINSTRVYNFYIERGWVRDGYYLLCNNPSLIVENSQKILNS